MKFADSSQNHHNIIGTPNKSIRMKKKGFLVGLKV
jgi:hypothetical protein